MKKYEGFEQAQAFTGEFETLKPGGYVCKILKVESKEKPYGELLRIAFDIAEGEHKDFYRRKYDKDMQFGSDVKWKGMYYQTVKQDDLRFFKGFITSIEKSNNGYKWDWDEKKLVGKLFGGVFGEEEYQGNDGNVKTSVKCMRVNSVETVKNGIEPPPIKKLPDSISDSLSNTFGNLLTEDDSDLPF